ncbi:beta-galactosidase trimerization domain-containing protein [Caulobacter segnis]
MNFSYQNYWLTNPPPGPNTMPEYFKGDYTRQAQAAYKPFFEDNIDAAVIDFGHDKLDRYKLLVLPSAYVMDEATATAVRDCMSAKGGTPVIMTGLLGQGGRDPASGSRRRCQAGCETSSVCAQTPSTGPSSPCRCRSTGQDLEGQRPLITKCWNWKPPNRWPSSSTHRAAARRSPSTASARARRSMSPPHLKLSCWVRWCVASAIRPPRRQARPGHAVWRHRPRGRGPHPLRQHHLGADPGAAEQRQDRRPVGQALRRNPAVGALRRGVGPMSPFSLFPIANPACAPEPRFDMRTLVCQAPFEVRLTDRPTPEAADGEVLIRIRRVGLCGTGLPYLQRTSPVPHLPAGDGSRTGRRDRDGADRLEIPGEGRSSRSTPIWRAAIASPADAASQNACVNIRVLGVHVDGGMCEMLAVPERAVIDRDGPHAGPGRHAGVPGDRGACGGQGPARASGDSVFGRW